MTRERGARWTPKGQRFLRQTLLLIGFVILAAIMAGWHWHRELTDTSFVEPIAGTGVILAASLSWFPFSSDRPINALVQALRRRGEVLGTVCDQDVQTESWDGSRVGRMAMRVEYELGGERRHISWYPSDMWTNSQGHLRRVRERYPPGTRVAVRFDPNQPEDVRAGARVQSGDLIRACFDFFGMSIFLMGIFGFVFGFSAASFAKE